MERQALVVPRQADELDQPLGLALGMLDGVLVIDGDHHAFGQNLLPMLHQLAILAVIAAEFAEVVAVRHVVLEQLGERRQAGVDRVAAGVNDLGVGHEHMDQPDEVIIGQQFVGHSRRAAGAGGDLRDVIVGEQLELGRADLVHHRREPRQRGEAVAQLAHRSAEIFDFAGAIDLRVARQDLLGQGRSRSRHPDDEHRPIVRITGIGSIFEPLPGEGGADRVEEFAVAGFRKVELGALHPPAGNIVIKRARMFAAVLQRLAERKMEWQQLVGLKVVGVVEHRLHLVEQFVFFREIDEVVEIGEAAVHLVVELDRLHDLLARFVEAADRFQRDAIEIMRLGGVGARLDRILQDLNRFIVAVGFVHQLAKRDLGIDAFGIVLEHDPRGTLGKIVISERGLDPRHDQQGRRMAVLDPERVAKNAQRLSVALLRRVDIGEVVVRLHVRRHLLNRAAERMLGLVVLALGVEQGAEIVIGLGIDFAVDQCVLIRLHRPFAVARHAQRIAEIVISFGHIGLKLDREAVLGDRLVILLAVVMHDSKIVARLRVVGLEPERFLELDRGLIGVAVLAKDFAEVGMIARNVGMDPDRAANLGDRLALLAERIERHAEDVVGVGILRLALQDLAAHAGRRAIFARRVELARHCNRLGRGDRDLSIVGARNGLVETRKVVRRLGRRTTGGGHRGGRALLDRRRGSSRRRGCTCWRGRGREDGGLRFDRAGRGLLGAELVGHWDGLAISAKKKGGRRMIPPSSR